MWYDCRPQTDVTRTATNNPFINNLSTGIYESILRNYYLRECSKKRFYQCWSKYFFWENTSFDRLDSLSTDVVMMRYVRSGLLYDIYHDHNKRQQVTSFLIFHRCWRNHLNTQLLNTISTFCYNVDILVSLTVETCIL